MAADEGTPGALRRLPVDLPSLSRALFNAVPGSRVYLDRDTGDLLVLTDDDYAELRRVNETMHGYGDLAFRRALAQAAWIPGWQRPAVADARRVDEDARGRFAVVPRDSPSNIYRDIEAFLQTMMSAPLASRLRRALDEPRGVARFRDVLYPQQLEWKRWQRFQAEAQHTRMLAWLAEQGIEPE